MRASLITWDSFKLSMTLFPRTHVQSRPLKPFLGTTVLSFAPGNSFERRYAEPRVPPEVLPELEGLVSGFGVEGRVNYELTMIFFEVKYETVFQNTRSKSTIEAIPGRNSAVICNRK